MDLQMQTLIKKKRDGGELSKEEIQFFINKVVSKTASEAQIGAMLMAMYLKDLNATETAHLTQAMTYSGRVHTWPAGWRGIMVDKHSTGGVGDKVSHVLVPALAACGLKVPMISGRGLNHTGGTLDKLEAIPGFKVSLTYEEIYDALDRIGCCITGQTEDIVPADKILYARRDETCTVENYGLITGSIISKKAAESLDVLLLDVKVGRGAFMKDMESARILAKDMVAAGNSYNTKTIAILSDMNTPLGNMIGNALEIVEVICCLQGEGPSELMDLVVEIGGRILSNVDKFKSLTLDDARAKIKEQFHNGAAMQKFCEMLKAQGVHNDTAEELCQPFEQEKVFEILQISNKSEHVTELTANRSGKVQYIDALTCGKFSTEVLGAGRGQAADQINYRTGLEIRAHVGTAVTVGDTLVKVYHDKPLTHDQLEKLKSAFKITTEQCQIPRRRFLEAIE